MRHFTKLEELIVRQGDGDKDDITWFEDESTFFRLPDNTYS